MGLGLEGNISLRIAGVASDRNDIITVYSVRLAVVCRGAGLALDGNGDFLINRSLLPLCIENIGFNLIHAGGRRTGGEANAIAVLLGVPASKRVAIALGKLVLFYQFIIGEKINEAVIL